MRSESQNRGPIRFGVYEVDLPGRTLRKSGVRIRMQEKPFRLLAMLLARPGEVVTREELQRELWPNEEYGEFDLGLNTAVKKLRQALGDSSENPRWIETIPKIGYRFLGNTNGPGSSVVPEPAAHFRSWRPKPVLVGGVIACAIWFVLGFIAARSPERDPGPQLHLQLAAPAGVAYQAFALSPDGTRVAFVGEGNGPPRLWVQSLTDGSVQALDGTENADIAGTPFWSPDSLQIGFFADHKLKRIFAAGGVPQTVCDAPHGRGGSWNKEGVIVFAPDIARDAIWEADLSKGTCKPCLMLSNGAARLRNPQFLPDQDHFLFTRRLPLPADAPPMPFGRASALVRGRTEIAIGSLGSEESTTILEGVRHATYLQPDQSDSGYLLYVREAALLARPFDPQRLSFSGPEVTVASGVGVSEFLARGLFSGSDKGVLAYLPEGTEIRTRELGWFRRDGEYLGRVTEVDSFGFNMHLSPDTKWVIHFTGPMDVQRLELTRGVSTALDRGIAPLITPRGDAVVYKSDAGIVWRPIGGVEARTLVEPDSTESGGPATYQQIPNSVSERLGILLYQRFSESTQWDLWTAPLETGGRPLESFLETPASEFQAKFSPNANWVAYASDETGQREVYVRAFPSADRKVRISTDGGELPRWGRDGNEIFYVDRKGFLTAAAIGREADELRPGYPERLFAVGKAYSNVIRLEFGPGYTYDVTREGDERFLIMWRPPHMPFPPLQVLVNWQPALSAN